MTKTINVPDPGEDFEGCIDALAEQAGGYIKALLPDKLPPLEKARRRLAMSGHRYIRLLESNAPLSLLVNEERIFDHRACDFLAALTDAERRLIDAVLGNKTAPEESKE